MKDQHNLLLRLCLWNKNSIFAFLWHLIWMAIAKGVTDTSVQCVNVKFKFYFPTCFANCSEYRPFEQPSRQPWFGSLASFHFALHFSMKYFFIEVGRKACMRLPYGNNLTEPKRVQTVDASVWNVSNRSIFTCSNLHNHFISLCIYTVNTLVL